MRSLNLFILITVFLTAACGKEKENQPQPFRPGASSGSSIQGASTQAQAKVQAKYSEDFFEARDLVYSLEAASFTLKSPLIVPNPVPEKITLKFTIPQIRGLNLRVELITYYNGVERELLTRIISQEIANGKLVVSLEVLNLAQFVTLEERPSLFQLKILTNERQEKFLLSFRMPPKALNVSEVSDSPLTQSLNGEPSGFVTKSIGVNAAAVLVKKIRVRNNGSDDIRLLWNQSLSGHLYAQFEDIAYVQLHSCGVERRITNHRVEIGTRFILLEEGQSENRFSVVSASGEAMLTDIIVRSHQEKTLDLWAIINPRFAHFYKVQTCVSEMNSLVASCHQGGCAEWRENCSGGGRGEGRSCYPVCARYHMVPDARTAHAQSFSMASLGYELNLAQVAGHSFYSDAEPESQHQSISQNLLEEKYTVHGVMDFNSEIRPISSATFCQ